MAFIDGVIDNVQELFGAVWSFVKRISEKIVNFVKNIVSWFKDPSRHKKLQENKKLIATSIKRNLENGQFNVINCLYDTEKEDIVGDYDVSNQYAAGIESEGLDSETKNRFGDKDMIILK